jgi:hypothetical protein
MATTESTIDRSKYRLDYEDWNLPDAAVIAKMKKIIQALEKKEIDAVTVLNNRMEFGDANAAVHIFGRDANHFCGPELISTWLSLLVLLASSENVTGRSIASGFIKGCGGCMVYTIFMVVACFPSKENTRLAFDFFRHVLADPKGEIVEFHEVEQIASLLDRCVPRQGQEASLLRSLCLSTGHFANYGNATTSERQTADAHRNLVEGLGALCTSSSFASAMKANSTSVIKIIKKSIENKTFSRGFVNQTR